MIVTVVDVPSPYSWFVFLFDGSSACLPSCFSRFTMQEGNEGYVILQTTYANNGILSLVVLFLL